MVIGELMKTIVEKLENGGVRELVCDFDGVLCVLEVDWESLRRELGSRLGGEDTIRGYYKKCRKERGFEVYRELVLRYELEALEGSSSTELFGWLKENRVPVHVLTNNFADTVKMYFDKHGANGLLKQVVGAGEVSELKPATEGLEKLMGNNLIDGWLMVGDAETDRMVAEAVGVPYLYYRG